MLIRSLDKVAIYIENTHQYKVCISICKKYGILRKKNKQDVTYPCYITIDQVSSDDYIAQGNFQSDMDMPDSIKNQGYFILTINQFNEAAKDILCKGE